MIKYRNISTSSDCPFYTMDDKEQRQCLVKYTNTLNIINIIADSPVSITKAIWQSDCGGDWANCCFIPLLYDTSAPDTEESVREYVDDNIDEYDPFSEEEPDAEEEPDIEEEAPSVVVRINQVENPYKVKGDVLVYPANRTLLIDDPELNRMSRMKIQDQCDNYANNVDIKTGTVYPTTNGGDFPGNIVAKNVYHAVVAGESRLVANTVEKAVIQSLIMADKQNAKVVLMMPFDCGMNDIGETARIQLTAISKFINKTKIKSIERIHIIMTDDVSVSIFKEYFGRIFD